MPLKTSTNLYHKIISFLGFLFQSRNKHGVHSPFVFNLITNCLGKKLPNKYLILFSNYKKELRIHTSTIDITDYNADSKIIYSNKKNVLKIAKDTIVSTKRAKLLMNLMHYFNPDNILEIGTSLGSRTAAISISAPDSKITTLESCKETGYITKKMFEKYNFKNSRLVIGSFDTSLPKELKNNNFDFIYFNGNHTKKATLDYFKLSLASVNNDSMIVVNNIHSNKEMEQAWIEIKNHSKVTVSIDTYQWGIVFFRKEQQKEHFIIRI